MYFAIFCFICPPSRGAEEAAGKVARSAGRGDVSRQEEHVARGKSRPAGATSESIGVRCSARQRPNNDWQLRRCGEWRIEARVCEKGNKVMT